MPVWCAAELAYPELATQVYNSVGGSGVVVEKHVLDAYRPMNAILSLAIAGFTVLANEALRTGKLEELISYVEDDLGDQHKGEAMPWDWSLVGVNVTAAFARDTVGLTMLRGIEKTAKVSRWALHL
jgi:hypothetical protein